MTMITERRSIAARVTLGLATSALAFWLGAGIAGAEPTGPTDIAPCPKQPWQAALQPVVPAGVTLLPPVGPVKPPTFTVPSTVTLPPTLAVPPTFTVPPPVGDPEPSGPPTVTLVPPTDRPCGHQPTKEPEPEPEGEDTPSDEATPTITTPTTTTQPTPAGPAPGGNKPQAGSLAHTGTNAALLVGGGLALLGGGTGMLLLARRIHRRVG